MNYSKVCVRSVKGIQQGKLSSVFLQKIVIKVGKFDFQSQWFERVIFFLYILLGVKHGSERLHVGTCFGISEHGCCARFEFDGASIVEGRLFDWFTFDSDLA